MPVEEARARARVLKALAHPVRLQLVHLLHKQESCLSDLFPSFTINVSNLARHLAVLKQAGIIIEYRAGRRVMLRLGTPAILDAADRALEVAKADQQRRSRAVPDARR